MAKQPDEWIEFYESAWAKRSQLLDKFVREGLDPYAAIQKLNRFESKQRLGYQPTTQSVTFFENERQEGQYATGVNLLSLSSIGEKVVARPSYYRSIDLIMDYLEQEGFDAICELGAGFGQNLIEIYSRGGPRNIPYFAGELTSSGIELAKMLSEEMKSKGMDMRAFRFDHKNPDLSVMSGLKKVFIFSNHSIEQVTELPADYFSKIASHFEFASAFHFEPVGHQFEVDGYDMGEVTQLHSDHFHEKKWNANFFETLVRAHIDSKISVKQVVKNALYGDIDCPTTFVHWTSGSGGDLPQAQLPDTTQMTKLI